MFLCIDLLLRFRLNALFFNYIAKLIINIIKIHELYSCLRISRPNIYNVTIDWEKYK
jgi:hypothetical protein